MKSRPVVICIPTTRDRRERLAHCIDSIRTYAGYPHIIMTYENEYEGFVAAIHKILETLAPETLIWAIGDDVELCEPDTIARMVDAYHSHYPDNDGVVNPDDGIQCGALITAPLTTARIFRDGTPKDFFHNFADNIFTERMREAGKYTYLPNVHIKHNHWCNDKATRDQTYDVAHRRMHEDFATYQRLCSNRSVSTSQV